MAIQCWLPREPIGRFLTFLGKAITVKGSAGAKATIIDGGQSGSVVNFNSGEAATAVLTGFYDPEWQPRASSARVEGY
jgi:hypothetical protein